MSKFSENDVAYLAQLQSNIERMHEASKSCKNFCTGLVTATITVAVATKIGGVATVGFLPTLVFFFLDSFYLGIERNFISLYRAHVSRVRNGNQSGEGLFVVGFSEGWFARPKSTLKAAFSFSIWPFYTIVLVGCFWAGGVL